ncbi:MAG: stage 0 sporulation family protein [Spirochaetaceae bacterium]|jgi:cell fate regulator YaaT (PSP1 superfamily)|nr:stage 0 sporulation family protein [Spirochaetaceae bacterium]
MDDANYENTAGDDEYVDDDIAALEDHPEEESREAVIIAGAEDLALDPEVPLYGLTLAYSHETFIAAWPGEALATGDKVLVPTRYGQDLAIVTGAIQNRALHSGKEIGHIARRATEEDLAKANRNLKQEENAFKICKEKIKTHRLEMKLVSVHYLLEEPKILFFFTAENRVDFRELVKDLVSVFKTRIELRQIGVRDESRVVGGLGVCGRGYCCHQVSDKLKPVSIKMAKDQNLSLNSLKISGPCGRLLCCLAYEHNFYGEQRRYMPSEGCKIQHDGVSWKVTEVNVVAGRIRINAEDGRQLYLPTAAFEKTDNRWQVAHPELS